MAVAEPIAQQGLEDRLVSSTVAALEMFSIHIGRQLGLYRVLAGSGKTPMKLAELAGIDARYAREWLEQQAVAGFVSVEDTTADPDERRYLLTEHGEAVFVAAEDPSHVSPLATMVAGVGQAIDEVIDAYRSGDGVLFSAYGEAMREGQGGVNRPAFAHDLVPSWLGAVDGLVDRLASGGRIADLGCGVGWSTIGMVRHLPGAEVTGWDTDAASIESARRNAAEAGVDVSFHLADASVLADHGPFDLITVLEALHDMARPGVVLEAARQALAPGGLVLVADEKVADHFAAPGDEMERMMYGWSVTHCLPAARAESPSAAIGTVIRQSTVRHLASEAGFQSVEVLDVDAGFFRLYVLG